MVVSVTLMSRNKVVKLELREICTRYEAARADAFHVSVAGTATPVARLAGETSVGAGGAAGGASAVVKLRVADQSLIPPAFVAFTRQWYTVLLASPGTLAEVPATD